MTRFERPADFNSAFPYAHGTPRASTIKTLALLAALLAYAAGFVTLYPIVASSVAKSVAEGNDPVMLQFISP
jgi:hypothetical protein